MDGLRVLRSLGRMRAWKLQMTEQPENIIDEYIARWEDDLGAQGKPWRWLDTNRHIKWGKCKSMKRCHEMMCHVLEQSRLATTPKQKRAVEAQIIQCLEALHEFAVQADWRTAWPLTHLPDPVGAAPLVGTEVEMEVILAALKTREDLRMRSREGRRPEMQEQVSGDDEEKPKPKPKKKPLAA